MSWPHQLWAVILKHNQKNSKQHFRWCNVSSPVVFIKPVTASNVVNALHFLSPNVLWTVTIIPQASPCSLYHCQFSEISLNMNREKIDTNIIKLIVSKKWEDDSPTLIVICMERTLCVPLKVKLMNMSAQFRNTITQKLTRKCWSTKEANWDSGHVYWMTLLLYAIMLYDICLYVLYSLCSGRMYTVTRVKMQELQSCMYRHVCCVQVICTVCTL